MLTAASVVREYLDKLTPEQADRVLTAPDLCAPWAQRLEDDSYLGCLVMTAECADVSDADARDRLVRDVMQRTAKGDYAALHASNAYPALICAMGESGAFRLVKEILGEKNAPLAAQVTIMEDAPHEPALGRFMRQTRARLHAMPLLFF